MIRKVYNQWQRVTEALPDYEESVLVCNEKDPECMWFDHRSIKEYVIRDEHQFCSIVHMPPITHWMRIKTLNNTNDDRD